MEHVYFVAALWFGLAVISAIIAYHLKLSIAIVEICVGVTAAALASFYFNTQDLGQNMDWLKFLASTGAILLTFLAGAELDVNTMRTKLKEVSIVGLIGFFAPFLVCTLVAYYGLHWNFRASLLSGVALSTTSMAVVYAVMLETGLNKTEFGKGILGSCFVNDLGTVIALGLIFAPFTIKSLIFIVVTIVVLVLLPKLSHHLTNIYANRTAAIRTKWILLVLFGLSTLAIWSGSEAVLPAYLAGDDLAEFSNNNGLWLQRIRTLTVGFLTPFYFLRAGMFVSITAIIAAPIVFLLLFAGKVLSKIFGLFPVISAFRADKNERWYYTLMMSTGLTFGTISAMYGLTHQIVSKEQYSFLVATVIASAVIPTIIAGVAYLPKHLLPDLKVHTEKLTEIQDT